MQEPHLIGGNVTWLRLQLRIFNNVLHSACPFRHPYKLHSQLSFVMEVIAPSSPSRPAIDLALQVALQEFNSILTDEQRNELHRAGPVPDADSVLVFTAQLDDINRKGRSVATRLHTVLLSVQSFCSVVDTFVSSHPEIAALVWGSVKVTMQVSFGLISRPLTRNLL